MAMLTLYAQPIVQKIQWDIQNRCEIFFKKTGIRPKLAAILVGDDPASLIYLHHKAQAAQHFGLEYQSFYLPGNTVASEVYHLIQTLNQNPQFHGIILQRPLPQHFSEAEAVYWILPEKDVDAFHPLHVGQLDLGIPKLIPCTPQGILLLLKHYQLNPEGKVACIIGRSALVGKPMATLLLQAHATVLHCHRKTPDLKQWTLQADFLIVAAGQPHLIQAEHIKQGAVIIDVGIHRNHVGKIIGDVDADAVTVQAHALTPVPGGVGPMTIAMLMRNTLFAAEQKMTL